MILYENEICYRTLDFLGYPKYKVGFDGSVWAWRSVSKKRNSHRWKPLKPLCIIRHGHPHYCVYLNNHYTRIKYYLHRLVLLAFVGECPRNMQCCHYDDNGANNHLDNLRWDFQSNNLKDRQRNNPTWGQNITKSKSTLSEELVLKIRNDKISRTVDLAQAYNVSTSVIYAIRKNKTWKYLNDS